MSSFALKWLALAAMLIDHVTAVLYRCGLLPRALKTALRAVGRLAFPIFAWQAAQSWRHTADRARHLRRLMLGAIASAVPYALAFTTGEGTLFAFSIGGWKWLGAAAGLAAVCFGAWTESPEPDRLKTTLLAAITALVPLAVVRVGSVNLLGGTQSIFYTMLGAMLACSLLDGGQKKTPAGWLWRITALAALLWCFRFDYGIRGIFLICAFFLFPTRKTAWIAAVAVFGAWSAQRSGWSTDSLIYLLGYCAALIPLLLSDGSRGSGPRRLFYIFYPAHLAVLGVIQQLLLRL